MTPEHRQKLSEVHTGKIVSAETRAKMSQSKIGKPRPDMKNVLRDLVCPHCNKEGNGPIMMRWHFDNCSQKPNID